MVGQALVIAAEGSRVKVTKCGPMKDVPRIYRVFSLLLPQA